MFPLPAVTWWRFVIWLAIGMVFYWGAGMDHSKLATESTADVSEPGVRERIMHFLLVGLVMQVGGTLLVLVAYHFGPADFDHLRIWAKVIWGIVFGVPITIVYLVLPRVRGVWQICGVKELYPLVGPFPFLVVPWCRMPPFACQFQMARPVAVLPGPGGAGHTCHNCRVAAKDIPSPLQAWPHANTTDYLDGNDSPRPSPPKEERRG